MVVEVSHRRGGRVGILVLGESKAFRAASLTVVNQAEAGDLADLGEDMDDLFFGQA
jgi:hypothetical protein